MVAKVSMGEAPLYASKEQALSAPGEIYQHYKGGVYRLVHKGVHHSETLETGVVYEHLWPHTHGFWYRPESIFFGTLQNGEPRFKLVKET
jgi:hypothetical protein